MSEEDISKSLHLSSATKFLFLGNLPFPVVNPRLGGDWHWKDS